MTDRDDELDDDAAELWSDTLATVAKGGSYLAAGNLLGYAGRFVAALVLARLLGAENYGLYTLAISLTFLASGLGNLGLDAAMERYVAVLRKRGDAAGLWGTLQLGVGITAVSGLVLSTVTFFAAGFISGSVFDDRRLEPLIRIAAIVVPFLIATTLLTSIVRGFKRMDYSAFANSFIQPMVRLALIGVLAVIGLTPAIALVIFGLSYISAVIVLIGMVRRLHQWDRPLRDAKRYVREIALFSFPFWFAGVMNQLRRNIQSVLLAFYNSVVDVGIISLVGSANLLGRIAIMSIRTSLRPIIAETLDEGDEQQTLHLYQATTRWTLTANLPVFIVSVLYPVAIMNLFGESFEAGATALTIVVFGELASAATGTCGTLIDMSGLNLVKTVNKIFEVALTLAVNVWMISQWGLTGAAVAYLVSRASVQILRVIEVRIILGFQPYNIRILKPIVAAVVAFGVGRAMDLLIPADAGLGQFLLDAFVVAATYVGALVLLGISDEDRFVIRHLTSSLRRRRSQT